MEQYLAALGSLIFSIIIFAFGYGRMSAQVSACVEETDTTRKLIDGHVGKTDIHIDPVRDRESQRVVVGRLTKVETSLENLTREVRNESRAAGERQTALLQEVRAALNR